MSENTLVIVAGKTSPSYWKNLWNYRELMFFLSWRDILIRYRQTALGVLWAVVRPVTTTLILYLVFNRIAGLAESGVPYNLLILVGLTPWQFIVNSVSESGTSFLANTNLITKIFFPRIVLPTSVVLVNLLDFAISILIVSVLIAVQKYPLSGNILFLPLGILWMVILSIGGSLWLSSLNVKYRDFKYVTPFFFQIGLYLSPIGFSTKVIPGTVKLLYYLNPATGLIDLFRWSILSLEPVFPPGIFISLLVSLLLVVVGFSYFRKTEAYLSDII